MDYPIKTLSQLRPILQGFRKAAGLTQAGMASHLGVTQQTYAQLEANPAAVSVDRLFRVLRVLGVDLTLVPRGDASLESDAVVQEPTLSAPLAQASRQPAAARSTKKDSTATAAATTPATASARKAKSKAQSPRREDTPPATPARAKSAKAKATPRSTAKPKSTGKKREDW